MEFVGGLRLNIFHHFLTFVFITFQYIQPTELKKKTIKPHIRCGLFAPRSHNHARSGTGCGSARHGRCLRQRNDRHQRYVLSIKLPPPKTHQILHLKRRVSLPCVCVPFTPSFFTRRLINSPKRSRSPPLVASVRTNYTTQLLCSILRALWHTHVACRLWPGRMDTVRNAYLSCPLVLGKCPLGCRECPGEGFVMP